MTTKNTCNCFDINFRNLIKFKSKERISFSVFGELVKKAKNMPSLMNQCPDCGITVHIRKLRCPCGHVFRKSKSLTLEGASKKANAVARKN